VSDKKDHSSQKSIQQSEIKDVNIPLFHNISISVATLAAVFVGLITITWALAQFIYINPANKELQRTDQDLANERRSHNELKYDYKKESSLKAELEKEVFELSKSRKVPELLSPVDNRPIIGQYVTFKWNYKEKLGFKNFVLEIRRAQADNKWWGGSRHNEPDKVWSTRYPIPEGHKRRSIIFQFPSKTTGTYYWRIGTGELLYEYDADSRPNKTNNVNSVKIKDKVTNTSRPAKKKISKAIQEETRLWSRYGSFSVYPSVWDKLMATQKLIVGTTAPYLSYDYPIGCGGLPDNYDMDMVHWLAGELETLLKAAAEAELTAKFEATALDYKNQFAKSERTKFLIWRDQYLDNFKLRVVPKIVAWEDILTSVTNGDVDIAVANITRSTEREKYYRGLKFTQGYRNNEQAIITSTHHSEHTFKKGALEKNNIAKYLRGKKMAAQNSSTNFQAAKELEKVFGYEVDTTVYTSYVDVIEQVRSGQVEFGMIDQVRFDSVGYPDLIKLNIDLKPYLKKFNKEKFGNDIEEYAIAVSGHGGFNQLLFEINRFIDHEKGERDRGRGVLFELEEKHKYKNRNRFQSSLKDCVKQ